MGPCVVEPVELVARVISSVVVSILVLNVVELRVGHT